MIRWLIERCLQGRVLVVLLSAGLMAAGINAGISAPIDAFPVPMPVGAIS